MWAKVAEEMQVPWRAAEAMHWQQGEIDIAKRARVVPFTLETASNEPQDPQRTPLLPRILPLIPPPSPAGYPLPY